MLGYVHELWKPMPGRFKDVVTSLSSLCYGPKGRLSSIRTKECWLVWGCGSTGLRKALKGRSTARESAIGMNWIKGIDGLQDQADDAQKFVDSVKENYLAEEIYVFTQMNFWTLPFQRFRADWLCPINPYQVGEKATGAKVNGRMVHDNQVRQGSGWNYPPIPTPLVESLTGSTWSRPARRATRFVSSLKIKTRIIR